VLSDQQLFRRVAAEDEEAFRELYDRFADRVFRYALTLVRNRHLAEEVAQEAMIAVWKNASRFEGRSKVSTWIFGVARNKALDLMRREKRGDRVPDVPLVTPDPAPAVRREELVAHVLRGVVLRRNLAGPRHSRGDGQIEDVPRKETPGGGADMSDCERIRELVPWYATGSLSRAESRDVTAHLASCEGCREELAETLRLKVEVESELRRMPRLPDGVWRKVLATVRGQPIAQIDVGSFLLGFSLGARVRRGAVPVHGDLRVLGRRIRLFNVEKEDRE
jgi:RNA polymerase sigma factor (sigma-70 family)